MSVRSLLRQLLFYQRNDCIEVFYLFVVLDGICVLDAVCSRKCRRIPVVSALSCGIRHVKILIFCASADICIYIHMIPASVVELYQVPGMVVVMHDVAFESEHLHEHTKSSRIAYTHCLLGYENSLWSKIRAAG